MERELTRENLHKKLGRMWWAIIAIGLFVCLENWCRVSSQTDIEMAVNSKLSEMDAQIKSRDYQLDVLTQTVMDHAEKIDRIMPSAFRGGNGKGLFNKANSR